MFPVCWCSSQPYLTYISNSTVLCPGCYFSIVKHFRYKILSNDRKVASWINFIPSFNYSIKPFPHTTIPCLLFTIQCKKAISKTSSSKVVLKNDKKLAVPLYEIDLPGGILVLSDRDLSINECFLRSGYFEFYDGNLPLCF